ncbi:MAG: DUF1320 family protein [Bacteroidota bacterium]|jgi:phage gp36-like protein|nr:DUF1320 family protein [Bacteroidota bacterium]HHU96842.1 DUF1320 family protein [Petrimonas sp.]
MAFLTKNELKTHLYEENVDVISRNDETILTAAIDAAVQEAKGYLGDYDVNSVFGATSGDRNALLLVFVKDIAVWHFLNLCNAGTDLRLRQDRYERAIDWLKAVQKGNVTPDLPKAVDESGTPTGGIIIFGSNPKRNQHF